MKASARRHFEEQARWDESHIQSVLEIMRDDGRGPDAAYAELRRVLEDPDTRTDWIEQNADEIADQGVSPDAAFDAWRDSYLRHSKDRMYALKRNPAEVDPIEEAALEKYLEFHRYGAKHLDTVDIAIPQYVYKGGKGIEVRYGSRKVDPSTLRRPKHPVDYIHEFNAGVHIYRTDAGDGRERVAVPEEFRHVGALVKLGECLGFSYKADGGPIEGNARRPMPELACSINERGDAKCLYVIQNRQRVLAMIWGGALGVFARGIDG